MSFLLNLRFLRPLNFDHDAFVHHTLHVLDAPANLIPVVLEVSNGGYFSLVDFE